MQDWAELIRSIATLLWPVLGFVVILLFRQPLHDVLGRLRRGKVFGQEFELEERLRELNESAQAAASEVPELPQAKDDTERAHYSESSDLAARILDEAARQPKVALILLASELEREVRHLLASMGILVRAPGPSLPKHIRALEDRGAIPKHLAGSVRIFWDLRNRLVHGHEADQDDIVRAIDSGLTVLRAIQAIPHEINVVHHPGVEVYADYKGAEIRPEIKAVILETTSPGGAHKTCRVFPTTREYFKKGKRVTWEWNREMVIGESWYRDPDSREVRYGWSNSMEFAGRHLENV